MTAPLASPRSRLLPVYPRLALDLVRAEGSELVLRDGRRILDLYGGHAVCPLGHAHPELAAALADGYRTLDFYSNSLDMDVQDRAATAVLGDSAHLGWVHFVNSGTEANEAAIHLARALTGRSEVLAFDNGFHGRTLASLQATGLAGYQKRVRLPAGDAVGFVRFGVVEDLARITERTAVVLCESVPSLAGIYLPPDGYYAALEARCRATGALFALDEVQGGIGRLGTWFAHERFGVKPDLVTLAKSLAGGFPAGALVVERSLGARVLSGELGTTFGGGPMACRMIETVATIVRRDHLQERVRAVFDRLTAGLAGVPGVAVRGAGCLIGIQTPLPAAPVRDALLADGILVGTCSQAETIRLLPPYTVPFEGVDRFARSLTRIVHERSKP